MYKDTYLVRTINLSSQMDGEREWLMYYLVFLKATI